MNSAASPSTVRVGGFDTIRATRAELAAMMVADCLAVRATSQKPLPKLVFSSNGQGIALAGRKAEFAAAMAKADIVHADGMSVVKGSRWFTDAPLPERIATTDFFHDAARAAEEAGLNFYILGGREDQNAAAVEAIRALYPRLSVVGRRNGYFRPEEADEICRDIVARGTDVLWVALGKPLQEYWSAEHQERLRGIGWVKTCGGLLSFLTGEAPRAPEWMRSAGLEWLHRTMHEPIRLGPRYIATNPDALYRMARFSGAKEERKAPIESKPQWPGWTPLPHVKVAGVPIATASRQELAEAMAADCRRARETGEIRPRTVFDANGHGLSLRETDASYREAYDQADVVHADGGFLVTFSRAGAGPRIAERSATTDMIHDFARVAEAEGLSFYLLGGEEEVNAECVERLRRFYPRLKIAGRRNGYFAADEEETVVAAINAAKPDVLWVGLGKPKEQIFSIRARQRLHVPWIVTCGGCFNYITGHYRRAPEWMQKANLEWVHRAGTEPRRLLWRYLTTSPHALWLALSRLG
ncbi:MAG TPA: WecB/TagA/CpsF family glycosyltransferase [Allosphingosinicella sp.]|uniref:WecB/TagA/CpsF family glycosyltransferase n=1 Tax=Allosphingosinicella sp. TaxID=2823234 RepID=UPI002ED7C159